MDTNPFYCNSPVTGSQFFGRTDFLASLQDTVGLPAQFIPVLYGLPRYGKTSLLQEFAARLSADSFIPVYWSLKDNLQLSWEQAVQSLAITITKQTPELQLDPAAGWTEEYFDTEFLPQVVRAAGSKRLVLLLDDIDVSDSFQAERASLASLVEHVGANQSSIWVIVSSSTRIEDLPKDWTELSRPLELTPVPPLRAQAIGTLIKDLSSASGITFANSAIEMIIRYCAGHAYLIQLVCHEAFELVRNSGETKVQPDTIAAAQPAILEKSSPAISPLVAGLAAHETETLMACADLSGTKMFFTPKEVSDYLQKHRIAIDEKKAGQIMAKLQHRGVLSKEMQGVYSFKVPLFAHWVMANYAPEPTTYQRIASRGSLLVGVGIFLVALIISIAFWAFLGSAGPSETPSGPVAVIVDTPTISTDSTSTPSPEPAGGSTTETTAPAGVEPTPTPMTPTETPTKRPTATPVPSSTSTPTPTPEPSATPTEPILVEPTPEPTVEPPTATATPTPATVATQVPVIASSPTATSTLEVTPLPRGLQILDLDASAGSQPPIIYAAAKDEGVYQRGLDGSWSLLSSDLGDGHLVRRLGLRSGASVSSTLYAGYAAGARRYSELEGWSEKSSLPRFHDFVSIPNSSIVFAGSETGIYRSLDDGNSWEPVSIRLDGRLIEVPIYGLALAANAAGNWSLLAAGGDSAVIFRTTVDPSEEASIQGYEPRWEDVPCRCEAFETFYAIAADPTNDQIIYVGNDRSRISYSSDGGISWTTTIVPVGQAPEAFVTEIELAPGNTAAYAATGGEPRPYNSNGLLVRNLQNDWSAFLPPGFVYGEGYVSGIAIDPNNPRSVYVGSSTGLFRFDNPTKRWVESP